MAPIHVEIIESERGWSQRIDDVKVFKTMADAAKYVKEFNTLNDKPNVPDWYMYARIVGAK